MSLLIFANGDLAPGTWLDSYLEAAEKLIAADGGARHLAVRGRRPDILIGDLDSLEQEMIDRLVAAGSTIIQYDSQKDETDLELALRYAAGRPEWRELSIYVFGVLGGRLDQTLANILLLAHPEFVDRHIRLIEPHQQAWLIRSTTTIEGEIGDRVSLIPLGGDVTVAWTSGLKWPLQRETLTFGPARGVSNEITRSPAQITLAAGLALCIHTVKGWQR